MNIVLFDLSFIVFLVFVFAFFVNKASCHWIF